MQKDRLIYTIVFGIVFSLFTSCATKSLLVSHYHKGIIGQDSIFNQTQANFYSKENDISLKLFHNSHHVDIIIETNNPVTVNKIILLGLELWIDPQGKSHRILGINYPLPSDNPNTLRKDKRSSLHQTSALHIQKRYDQLYKELELVNFTPGETLIIPSHGNDQGIRALLTSTPDLLFRYHLTLPFNRIFPISEGEKEHILSIGINSLNETDEEYSSSLSSKEVVRRRMQTLKAGKPLEQELSEQWVTFRLTNPK